MRLSQNPRPSTAFTLIEVLVIIVTVLLLAGVFYLWKPRMTSKRVACVNNLKQVGLAVRLWSFDSSNAFLWTRRTNRGGTFEYVSSPEVFRHFQALSNELGNPKILVCPSDHVRLRVNQFVPPISNTNVSYFLGFDAEETKVRTILSGDRNITGGTSNAAGLVFEPTDVPGWDAGLHHHEGNIGLGDGSVQQVDGEKLAKQFAAAWRSKPALTAMQFAIPRVPGEKAASDGLLFGIDVPIPLVGAVVIGAGVLVGWWFVRHRILANATEASISDAGAPSESPDERGPK
jgi:hypothetical protein